MSTEGKQRTLRAVSPELYHYITEKLADENIHQYDIQSSTVETGDGQQVFVHTGENSKQSQSQFFSHESIKRGNQEIEACTDEIAEACKETMIADYFKMVKM